MPRPLQVFLCHASQDKPDVLRLHRNLKRRNVKPWLDKLDLLPGENWEIEIPNALFSSDVILVCLSKNSVDKEGYVQREIAFALDKALEKPDGTIFIIPVKLEECDLPKKLSRFQAVELFRKDGFNRLLLGLNKRIRELGDEVEPIILEETRQRTPKPFKPEIQIQEEPDEIVAPSEPDKNSNEVKPSFVVEKKKDQAKSFTKILNSDSLVLQNPQLNENKKVGIETSETSINLFQIAIIFTVLIGIVLVLSNIFDTHPNSVFFQTLTPTNDQNAIFKTNTSSTPVILTPTIPLTKSLAISTTTRLTIGSTTVGDDDMILMYVPAGEFIMGSNSSSDEQPIHQAYLDAYWIDQEEVTYGKYLLCLDTGRCNPPSQTVDFKNDSYLNYPVVYVSWEDAKTYCEWAGRRLPTEAEWEKAARGTEGNIYPWGNIAPNSELLNYNDEIGETTEVGNYPLGVSIYGALDMSGNVFEWVNDWYDANYYQNSPSSNPLGPSTGEYKVHRGGSWYNEEFYIRSSFRGWYNPTNSYDVLGFRCAMEADQ